MPRRWLKSPAAVWRLRRRLKRLEFNVAVDVQGLTKSAIAAGFPQGSHSSDPSGDGHGPGTADEPRVGLANVVAQGDLNATCELIDSLLNP